VAGHAVQTIRRWTCYRETGIMNFCLEAESYRLSYLMMRSDEHLMLSVCAPSGVVAIWMKLCTIILNPITEIKFIRHQNLILPSLYFAANFHACNACHSGQLSLVIPLREGKMSTSDGYCDCWGRKQQVLYNRNVENCISVYCQMFEEALKMWLEKLKMGDLDSDLGP